MLHALNSLIIVTCLKHIWRCLLFRILDNFVIKCTLWHSLVNYPLNPLFCSIFAVVIVTLTHQTRDTTFKVDQQATSLNYNIRNLSEGKYFDVVKYQNCFQGSSSFYRVYSTFWSFSFLFNKPFSLKHFQL